MFNKLPHYRSHKIVAAALILSIATAMPAHSEGNANASDQAFRDSVLTLQLLDRRPDADRTDPMPYQTLEHSVDADWMSRHRPEAGGYFVAYEGGYTSFSPKDPFDGGYTLLSVAEAEEEAKLAEIIASVRAEERQKVLDELAAQLPAAASVETLDPPPPEPVPLPRPTKNLTLGGAMDYLNEGCRLARAEWNGDAWLMRVNEELADTVAVQFAALKPVPWVGQKTPRGGFVPYTPTQADLLAKDWFVVFPA
jgi:hypothetical protein